MKFKKSVIAVLALGMITGPLFAQPTATVAAKKVKHSRKTTTKTYGQLTISQRNAFKIAHADPKAILTLDQKHTVPGNHNKTYYSYQLNLTNKTKHQVKFYFSNLKLNSFNTTSKKFVKVNVKPSYTAKHIVLKPKASKTVKNAVTFKVSKYNLTTKDTYYFLEYGKFNQNKEKLAGVQFGTN